MTKERPILFSTPMVRAIMDGGKTQTRRIIKPSPGLQRTWLKQELIDIVPHGEMIQGGWQMHHPLAGQYKDGVYNEYDSPLGWVKCPYGKIGDILWVRETWAPKKPTEPEQDWQSYYYLASDRNEYVEKWKPSIFMSKEASRIKLEITDIKVERVQDISYKDAIAEGVESSNEFNSNEGYLHQYKNYMGDGFDCDSLGSYYTLWESINGKGSWDKNPWVWVIKFNKL